MRVAAALPPGPTFISPGWDKETSPPELITVVTTRLSPDGMIVPAIALIDRTCLGVKNGFVAEPIPKAALQRFMAPIIEAHGSMEEVDLVTALSIVHHAIDYARSLGFEPHPDFPAPLFGPRPESLKDTVYMKPARPLFMAGPDDDAVAIARRLELAVGAGNFDVSALMLDNGDDEDEDAEP